MLQASRCLRPATHASLAGKTAPTQDGFSGDQQFFIAFGQNHASKGREAALRQQVMTDPHSPAQFAQQPSGHIDTWYAAFNVQPGRSSTSPRQIE